MHNYRLINKSETNFDKQENNFGLTTKLLFRVSVRSKDLLLWVVKWSLATASDLIMQI